MEKGPLIAGFRVFSSRNSIIDPFDHNCPESDQIDDIPRSKRDQTVPFQGPGPYPTGPGSIQQLPWMALVTALATGPDCPKIQEQ